MKLKIVNLEDSRDYRTHQKLLKNGKEIYSVHDLSDCPEDATVHRDLLSCGSLMAIVKGFEGEKIPIDIDHIEVSTWEEYENITE